VRPRLVETADDKLAPGILRQQQFANKFDRNSVKKRWTSAADLSESGGAAIKPFRRFP
jgi:hypothetical protein